MSRNLSDRNTHFNEPGIATMPVRAPRPDRATLVMDAIRAQKSAVEIDGVVALYSAMRPSEQKIAKNAIRAGHYQKRQQPNGMTIYVIQPQATQAQPQAADQPKQKLSKRQRELAEKEMLKQLAAVVAAAKPAAKPKRLRNRHDDLAAARALKEMVTGQ